MRNLNPPPLVLQPHLPLYLRVVPGLQTFFPYIFLYLRFFPPCLVNCPLRFLHSFTRTFLQAIFLLLFARANPLECYFGLVVHHYLSSQLKLCCLLFPLPYALFHAFGYLNICIVLSKVDGSISKLRRGLFEVRGRRV